MQLGRGGECLACRGGSRTTNQNPQQPLIGMIFTNADPRYAGRFDDKQGDDTIVTMERVREAITFNAELADESTWLWLTSDHQRGQYYEHYSRSLVPRELKEKPLLPFSQRDEEIYSSGGGKKDQR